MSISIQTTLESVERPSQPLGVHHSLLVFTSPRSLFSRVEDTGAYGWALVLLLGLSILIGYVEVQSGLIDRVVDQQTQDDLADLEKSQGQLIDRIELRDRMEQVMKASLDEITRTWNVHEWDGIPIGTDLLVLQHGLAQARERFAQGACSDSLQHDQPMKLDF